jgi:putative tricarboxylic transport membrane protein
MIRGAKDFWAGLIYIFFGASAIIVAHDYVMGTAVKMGPAYFPSLLGGILIAIGAVSVVRSFIVSGSPIGTFAVKSLSLIVASVLLFGVLVRTLGTAISLPLLVLVSAYGSVHFRWGPTLALALGLTTLCILVFLKGLGIPLPIWGTWLGN